MEGDTNMRNREIVLPSGVKRVLMFLSVLGVVLFSFKMGGAIKESQLQEEGWISPDRAAEVRSVLNQGISRVNELKRELGAQ
jgi:hypothetical protein